MLQPKRTKFRRVHKMKMKGNAQRGSQLAYGTFGIKATEGAWITARQIEAARIAATRYMKRKVSYGSKSSRISQLLRNQRKYVWVKVKVLLNTG